MTSPRSTDQCTTTRRLRREGLGDRTLAQRRPGATTHRVAQPVPTVADTPRGSQSSGPVPRPPHIWEGHTDGAVRSAQRVSAEHLHGRTPEHIRRMTACRRHEPPQRRIARSCWTSVGGTRTDAERTLRPRLADAGSGGLGSLPTRHAAGDIPHARITSTIGAPTDQHTVAVETSVGLLEICLWPGAESNRRPHDLQ